MQNKSLENYHQSDRKKYFHALISSIFQITPATAVVAEAYNQYVDIKRWEYLEDFCNEVKESLVTHEKRLSELDDKTDPDEIIHLMFIAIDKVKFEYQETRRKEYAKLFVNSIILGNTIDFDKKRMFIQLFGELSDGDIDLLGKFYATLNSIHDGAQLEIFGRELVNIVPFVMRLESRGLIYQRLNDAPIKTTIYEGHKTNLENAWRNKVYGLTPMGMSFCEFLSSDL